MGESDRPPLGQLWTKAQGHPFFVASALAECRQRRNWDDRQLAEHLGCPPQALPRLGLCRRPSPAEPDFAARVRRIAEYAPCNPDALLVLLREASVLAALRETAPSEDNTIFLAARDRKKDGSPPGATGDPPP